MGSWPCGLALIEPAKPVQNAFIESFNSRLRDECLNEHLFDSLAEARQIIKAWRLDYNYARPPSTLATLAPSEFAEPQGKLRASPPVPCSTAPPGAKHQPRTLLINARKLRSTPVEIAVAPRGTRAEELQTRLNAVNPINTLYVGTNQKHG